MQILAYLYDLVHITSNEKGRLDEDPQGRFAGIGYQLEHVQEGADPDDWKSMSCRLRSARDSAFGNPQEFFAAFK